MFHLVGFFYMNEVNGLFLKTLVNWQQIFSDPIPSLDAILNGIKLCS
jgi:hypothetical protein